VRALAAEIASERRQVTRAVAALDPASFDGDRAALAQALRARLPQAEAVEIYSAGLDEVLHANYRTFGYAKAAQLMAAQTGDGPPPVQTVVAGGQRRLSLVQPLGDAQRPKGWVWVELPFTPLQQRFESIAPGGGRIDLRQGDDRGELSLLSRGAASAEAEETAKPVAGSSFSVRAALPAAFILFRRRRAPPTRSTRASSAPMTCAAWSARRSRQGWRGCSASRSAR
jgi:phosphomannomutase/phosphoglucomutase